MWFGIITIFPEMFSSIIKFGIINKAIKKTILQINFWNPRDYSKKKNRSVDDYPYGGGVGMIMNIEPIYLAIQAAKCFIKNKTKIIYLSPQGKKMNQKDILKLSLNRNLILVCGRYKGIDERLIKNCVDEEWSIGDYILSGGELPAMVLIDCLVRVIPGVLGKIQSAEEDSFSKNLLEHSQYTRPKKFLNYNVPDILLSGNHAKIKKWKLKHSLGKTWKKRPDLLKNITLTKEEKKLLLEYQNKYKKKI
ncbi:tRNA (guanosine(37)-N1)-methyltransferase TrmD [Buchnera aphidicola (Mindarus keteleerifoliae)]|uniref:tRNA (guanosine(37)-N1)-methyltransferase TrmD n=1 Tax=Buchnera aphidicola TaxID=9 RepID=UPI0031B6B06B